MEQTKWSREKRDTQNNSSNNVAKNFAVEASKENLLDRKETQTKMRPSRRMTFLDPWETC